MLAGTDEAALGAIDAIKQAGRSAFSPVVSQGADAGARAEMLTPDSLLLAAVSYVPERYGPQLIDLAMSLLKHEPVPPAVYITHELATADTIRSGQHSWLDPADPNNAPDVVGRRSSTATDTDIARRSVERRAATEAAPSTH